MNPTPEAAPPAPSPPPRRPSRAMRVLRAAIRQLAAAVYVLMAYGLLVTFLAFGGPGGLLLEAFLTFAAGAILTLAVEGALAETGLVGLVVGLLQLAFGFVVSPPEEGELGRFLLSHLVTTAGWFACGLAGALVVRFRRSRKAIAHRHSGPA